MNNNTIPQDRYETTQVVHNIPDVNTTTHLVQDTPLAASVPTALTTHTTTISTSTTAGGVGGSATGSGAGSNMNITVNGNGNTTPLDNRAVAPTVFMTDSTNTSATIDNTPRITVGPIIGKVTDVSARILVETNVQMKLIARLTLVTKRVRSSLQELTMAAAAASASEQSGSRPVPYSPSSSRSSAACTEGPPIGHMIEKEVDTLPNRIALLTFGHLHPDCRYELSFANIPSRPSTFHTMVPNTPISSQMPLRYGIVSCNLLAVTQGLEEPTTDLWLDLQTKVLNREIDYVFHIGDQIYADEKRDKRHAVRLVFAHCVEMLNGLPRAEWPVAAEHCKELYRQLYRDTWTHPPTAAVLANCPNLMIFDDHDFRDDWGNEPEDHDPTSTEYFVGRCAHRVMCEYQRQLWDDVDFDNLASIKTEFHLHRFGAHGVAFVDVRGPRSLHHVIGESLPYLGKTQWNVLEASARDDGIFGDVQSLMVICPTPIVFLPTNLNDILGKTVIDDALGNWCSAPFKAEQIKMLEWARNWKIARPGRELTFLGGDVHVGGHTIIYYKGEEVFHQLITSAIANFTLTAVEFAFGRVSQEMASVLDENWTFCHKGFTRQRNYGIVETSRDGRGVLVSTSIITPKGKRVVVDNHAKPEDIPNE
jgi:hypothetical protein